MNNVVTAQEIAEIACVLDARTAGYDCQMPTLEELERDLALDSPSWTSLLRQSTATQPLVGDGLAASPVR